ncbi:DNA-binding protein RHL1 [Gracilaria domingensis]|nr:DNA-binding protein RHL1 [Gracilaria domingensis]
MGPKPKNAEQTEEEVEAEKRSAALRKKSHRTVIAAKPPASQHRIPKALRQCDNADITKRNASRKKKYLFLFPGALELPPGARIGQLDNLDTATPTLCVEVDGGKIIMSGTLVLPKNALFTLKAGNRRRELKVIDSLDTIVAFSEWRFLKNGVDQSEACALPSALIQNSERGLWKSERTTARVRQDDEDEEDDEHSWEAGERQVSQRPVRSNRGTKARVDYVEAEMDSDEFEDSDEAAEEMRHASKVIEHINLVDDEGDVTKPTSSSNEAKNATNETKRWTQTSITDALGKSNKGKSRVGRGRLKRQVGGSEEERDEVEIVDDNAVVQARSSARKRKKVTYTQSDDGSDNNVDEGDDQDDDYDFGADDEDL